MFRKVLVGWQLRTVVLVFLKRNKKPSISAPRGVIQNSGAEYEIYHENLLFSPGIALANQTLQLDSVKAERGFSKVRVLLWTKEDKL